MYRTIKPEKIRALRGDKTRKAVLQRLGGGLTESELAAYEHGVYKPSEKKLPYLLRALGCSFEDISEPVDMGVHQ